jgi:HAE1 family hydrophobic/amphiphilic exporter-1
MDIVERAKDAGVEIATIFNTMQDYGGLYTTDFNKFGKQYRVMIQAKPEDRANLESINNIYVMNNSGQKVAISQFVDFERIYGPEAVSRFNMLKSVNVNGKSNPGFSSGDAIKAVQEVAAQHLPKPILMSSRIDQRRNYSRNQAIVFLLSLIFVYFLLSAQYESYLVPLSILLSLPVGVAGAIGFVYLRIENNIYFQVALIMLIGLLAKNAILIEFAIQRRRNGMDLTKRQ